MNTWRILVGDVRERLAELPDESAQCVVTSPPYWGLRDYEAAGQLGLEATPEAFVANMVEVFRQVRRVMRRTGTLWLNMGDAHTQSGRGGAGDTSTLNGSRRCVDASRKGQLAMGRRLYVKGLGTKNLVGMPWRLALALQADRWVLRQEIIWHKTNPMPESCVDRPTTAHERIFLFSRSRRYYYDREAIMEPVTKGAHLRRAKRRPTSWDGRAGSDDEERGRYSPKQAGDFSASTPDLVDERNARSVWSFPTEKGPDDHFATYPTALVTPCVKAGSKPGDLVLDPFAGSGTTLVVAVDHQRDAIGIELNPEYAEMARKRLQKRNPLFTEEATT